MIGLDTNILVRYLTQDEPRQAKISADIIENRLTAERPGFVSVVVAAETVWVLTSRFKVSNREAAETIEGLISQDRLVFENHELVVQAVEDAKNTNADFADVLICELAKAAGCSTTLTFDVAASKLPGFDLAK